SDKDPRADADPPRARVNRRPLGKIHLRLASQRDDPARARTVIVGADLAGVDRHGPGMDEDAAAGGKKARIADIELRAALDVDRPEIADRQGGSVGGSTGTSPLPAALVTWIVPPGAARVAAGVIETGPATRPRV